MTQNRESQELAVDTTTLSKKDMIILMLNNMSERDSLHHHQFYKYISLLGLKFDWFIKEPDFYYCKIWYLTILLSAGVLAFLAYEVLVIILYYIFYSFR